MEQEKCESPTNCATGAPPHRSHWIDEGGARIASPEPFCENHVEVQHRDGKPPWCKSCGWHHGRPATPPVSVTPPPVSVTPPPVSVTPPPVSVTAPPARGTAPRKISARGTIPDGESTPKVY